MSIREFNISDVEFLLQSNEFFHDGWNRNMINSAIEGGRFFGLVCEEDGKKVAYLTYSKGIDDTDMESLFTLPDYRKRGIAQGLMDEFLKRENGRVLLEVRESNTTAITLYLKNGFKQISVRKKYYSDGENALILERK